jgi:hypothetical protein
MTPLCPMCRTEETGPSYGVTCGFSSRASSHRSVSNHFQQDQTVSVGQEMGLVRGYTVNINLVLVPGEALSATQLSSAHPIAPR